MNKIRVVLLALSLISPYGYCANLAENYWPDGRAVYRFYGGKIDGPYRLDQNTRSDMLSTMAWFNSNTAVRFTNQYQVHQLISPLVLDAAIFGNGSSRGEAGFPLCTPTSCVEPYVLVPNGASVGLMQHELTHLLGFYHEQQRVDRDPYLFLDTTGLSSGEIRFNYEIKGLPFGPFDLTSSMLYRNSVISYKSSSAVSAKNWLFGGVNRYARVKFDNSSSLAMPMKPALVAEDSLDVVSASSVNRDLVRGMWVFEKVNDVYFRMKNRGRNKYLASTTSGSLVLSTAPATAYETNWKVETDAAGKSFIRNRALSVPSFITLGTGGASLTAVGTPMVVEAFELDNMTRTLSDIDVLAINSIYKARFFLRSRSSGGNDVFLSSDDGFNVNTINFSSVASHLTDKASHWSLKLHSGTDGRRFEIVNLNSGGYLASVGGAVGVISSNTDSRRIWQLANHEGNLKLQNVASGLFLDLSSTPSSLTMQSASNTAWSFDIVKSKLGKFTQDQANGKLFEIGLAYPDGSPTGSKIYAKVSGGNLQPDLGNGAPSTGLWFIVTDGKDYRILNSVTGDILVANEATDNVQFAASSSGALHGPRSLWNIEEEGEAFKLKNVGAQKYLSFDEDSYLLKVSSISASNSLWVLPPIATSLDVVNEQLQFGNSFFLKSWNTTSTTSDDFFLRRGAGGSTVTLNTAMSADDSIWTINEIAPGEILDFHICKTYRNDNTADIFAPEFVPTKCLFENGGIISATDLDALNQGSSNYFRTNTSAFWHIEFYRDYLRIKNRASGKYLSRKLIGTSTVLELNASPTFADSLWHAAPAVFPDTKSFF